MAKTKHLTVKKLNAMKIKNNSMQIRNSDICTCDGKIHVDKENVDDFMKRLETLKKKYS